MIYSLNMKYDLIVIWLLLLINYIYYLFFVSDIPMSGVFNEYFQSL